tara:strand:+ start:178 stop:1089 length:912 start_codon:yes stop_codon:yes gene_type:complete
MKTSDFLSVRKKYLKYLKKQEILGQPFQDKYGQLKNYYIPICNLIYKNYLTKNKVIIIGLSGSQGSGKSTITEILKIILKTKYNLNTVSFSIDDFYKTLAERKKLSKKSNKLFFTRGVPATHDTKLLLKTFKNLQKKSFKKFLIPKFDKSKDDRMTRSKWKIVKRKPDVVIFEGWCVGAKHQKKHELKKPINFLEKEFDPKLIWRKKVNNQLKNIYSTIFKKIDKLIFLKVPSFQSVYRWRLLQERKLQLTSKSKKTMSSSQVKRFIMFYERITKQMMKDLPKRAQAVLYLDKKHKFFKIRFN